MLKFLLKESYKKPCLMLDNHSAAQRESLKWIEGELVKKRMYYILDKELADCFDGGTRAAELLGR